jgi:hypothetical protein
VQILRANYKKNTRINLEMGTEIFDIGWQIDSFVIGKRKVQKIFVDETLLKIMDKGIGYG